MLEQLDKLRLEQDLYEREFQAKKQLREPVPSIQQSSATGLQSAELTSNLLIKDLKARNVMLKEKLLMMHTEVTRLKGLMTGLLKLLANLNQLYAR